MTVLHDPLRVAVDLLERDGDDPYRRDVALALLQELADVMGELACLPDTDARTAGQLQRLRDDLSGHLRAAAALDESGLPASTALDMLRRGAVLTLAGLRAIKV